MPRARHLNPAPPLNLTRRAERAPPGSHRVVGAKIALPLGADVTGDLPRIEERWVSFTVLTRIDGVDYSGVPTVEGRD